MGSYTKYVITVMEEELPSNGMENILDTLHTVSDYSFYLAGTRGIRHDEEIKWYEYREDMYKVAAEFPSYTFMVYGQGEEDVTWKTYFKGSHTFHTYGATTYKAPPEIFNTLGTDQTKQYI